MITIDKIKKYLRSISKDEMHYNYLLDTSYVNPKYRNEECKHPEHETCATCPLNTFYQPEYEAFYMRQYEDYMRKYKSKAKKGFKWWHIWKI